MNSLFASVMLFTVSLSASLSYEDTNCAHGDCECDALEPDFTDTDAGAGGSWVVDYPGVDLDDAYGCCNSTSGGQNYCTQSAEDCVWDFSGTGGYIFSASYEENSPNCRVVNIRGRLGTTGAWSAWEDNETGCLSESKDLVFTNPLTAECNEFKTVAEFQVGDGTAAFSYVRLKLKCKDCKQNSVPPLN